MMDVIARSGEHYRVADPAWSDPLDGSYSKRFGGRWNPPGGFSVVYLNADLETARANARHFLTEKLRGQPFSAEDLEHGELPLLITLDLPERDHYDVVTSKGIVGNGLPSTYPVDQAGQTITWAICQPKGQSAWNAGLSGVACRSAAPHAPSGGEELAWFDRPDHELATKKTQRFDEWYGAFDW